MSAALGTQWQAPTERERNRLRDALEGNAVSGTALLTGPDTGFAGTAELMGDEEVIAAIRSVPCHY